MRILAIVAAAAVAVFAVPASASPAAPVVPASSAIVGALAVSGQVRVSVDTRRGYQHRRHGRRAHWRKTCRSYWHHGRRVRSCRRVRYWR